MCVEIVVDRVAPMSEYLYIGVMVMGCDFLHHVRVWLGRVGTKQGCLGVVVFIGKDTQQ